MADKETWKNVQRGTVAVREYDNRGNERHRVVRPGQTVSLTPQERELNQLRAADDTLDVFKNGYLVPVRFADTTEDAAEIASNSNLKSEEELRGLFELHWKKFGPEVEEITNAGTLERMLEIAEEVDATMRQVRVIETALARVNPSFVPTNDDVLSFGEPRGIKAVTPS